MKNKIIIIYILSALLLISSGEVQPESDRHAVPGKIILQLKPGIEREEILSEIETSYDDAGLQTEQCLSAELGIWLFSFDEQSCKATSLLDRLRKNEAVALVQLEHYISLREVIPNDSLFTDQWALRNTGQSGGLAGADIGAAEAWEYAVNTGTTVFGDSIVLAVIDDGFSLDHEDMNFWKNIHEIPDNGIDDDNNGYVDDFDGWNAFSASGDIPVRSHGTQVAGIAGAIGNNETGVCGVNWNCALLPVAGSSTFEGTVVAAYAYVYSMRLLYDETNGTKGAFIVATNSSFGVDFGNVDDYPIWGMMYDSLGSLGILNAAATMNKPWNVEDVGDVPTNFDSDYLIGVTNTTNKDLKYNTSGWGPVSIDLGAPGTNIITTKVFDSYGFSTGTSMASPQLSGSIALMFAAADSVFLQKYDDQPAAMAVFLKELILDGVDTLPGFDSLCVSGGRLNVNMAISKLLSPRIEPSIDTLRIYIAPDSTEQGNLKLQNLVGFDMPFTCSITDMPDWVGFTPSSGLLPASGNSDIALSFDASGQALGDYYCQMIIEDIGGKQCNVVIEMKVIPDLGQDEKLIEKNHFISAFPNPFSGDLYLTVQLYCPENLLIGVYSLTGELLSSWDEQAAFPGMHTIHWTGSDRAGNQLPPGIYIIRMLGNEFSEQVKVIKR